MSTEAAEAGLGTTLSRHLLRALRRAVFEHAAAENRRHFAAQLHVGLPGGPAVVRPITPGEDDHGLRVDLVAAMVARCGVEHPLLWITRTGDLDEVQDVDQEWLAAAVAAFAEAGRSLTFVTVNRHGWRDPRSGATRTWVRPRPRARRAQPETPA